MLDSKLGVRISFLASCVTPCLGSRWHGRPVPDGTSISVPDGTTASTGFPQGADGRIGNGIAKPGVGHELCRDYFEPFLEGGKDRNAVFLAKATHLVISRFAVIRLSVPHLPFNP